MLKQSYRYCLFGSLALAILLFCTGIYDARQSCAEPLPAPQADTFRLSINRPAGTPLYRWVDLIYSEVFRRLNINMTVVYHPLKRASIETSAGKADGEPARIYEYGTLYPDLVRVEESVFPMTVAAYTTDISIGELNGWKSLKNTNYLVEYPRGMKICESNLTKVIKPEFLSTISETSPGLEKLIRKRTDIYIDDVNSVLPLLHLHSSELQEKIHLAGIMEAVPLYMYVHKKHASLAPQLASILRELKAEGLIEQYHKIAFGISDDEAPNMP